MRAPKKSITRIKSNANITMRREDALKFRSVKKKWGCQQLLPDEKAIGRMFWQIISNQPVGQLAFAIANIIENLVQVGFSAITVYPFSNNYKQFQWINDSNTDPNNQSTPTALLTITASLNILLLTNVLCLCYLYFLQKRQQTDQNFGSLTLYVCQAQSIFFTAFGTFLHLIIIYFEVLTFYYLANSSQYTPPLKIAQLVLSMLLVIQTILLAYIYNDFYNLTFVNNILPNSGPPFSSGASFRPIFYFIQSALTLKPYQTPNQSAIFLTIIALFSAVQLTYSISFRPYFSRFLSFTNILMKLLKTSLIASLALSAGLGLNIVEFLLVITVLLPLMYGLTMFAMKFQEQIYFELLQGKGLHLLKSATQLEQALLLSFDYLSSDDDHSKHSKYLSLMLAHEESLQEEGDSFYKAITRLIQLQDYMENHDEEALGTIQDLQKSEDEKKLVDTENDIDKSENVDVLASAFFGDDPSQSIKKKRNPAQTSFYSSSISQLSPVMSMLMGVIGEGCHTKLENMFQKDTSQRDVAQNQKRRNKFKIQINGVNFDLSNLSQAIKIMKVRFFNDILLKKAMAQFPQNLFFKFFQAYIGLEVYQNKYLALTAVSHINTLSVSIDYRKQIQLLISANYFLKQILAKGNDNLKTEELNSDVLLSQAFHVDNIICKVKLCAIKISLFWQLVSQDQLSQDQLICLQEISVEISDLLRPIKSYIDGISKIQGTNNVCNTLQFYLSCFYFLVMRDSSTGNMILNMMVNVSSIGNAVQKNNIVDEVGVIVVDGNFDLKGKIQFANKILVKTLGYQVHDFKGKLIHMLMPEVISQIHNHFWNRFSQIGVPKVLDQHRFLFVKDQEGYISPFKIFVKFQFSAVYGYSFVGLFRKPAKLTFDESEDSVPIKKTYQMVCNKAGKILEISKSCNQLLKLSPTNLAILHNQLTDNLTLNILNQTLIIPQMEFSQHSCMYFKNIILQLHHLKTLIQQLDVRESHMEYDQANEKECGLLSNISVFRNIQTQFSGTMKIIKESYGSSKSVKLDLFYVIFAEKIESESNIENNIGRFAMTAALFIKGQESSESIEEENEVQRAQLGISHGVGNSSLMSYDGSIAASQSSIASSNGLESLKMIEEGIDYHKSPKPLIKLKVLSAILLSGLIIVSAIQYVLNNKFENQSLENQKILTLSVQNIELIASLTLMCRSFIDINIGFEPNATISIPDRKSVLQDIALPYIQELQANTAEINIFFDLQFQGGDLMSQQNETVYSILRNNSLDSQQFSPFNALSSWLVDIYQILVYTNSSSTVGTFLENLTYYTTSTDQLLFFVIVNSQSALITSMKNIVDAIDSQQQTQAPVAIKANNYYIGVASALILILGAGAIYYSSIIMHFKSRSLAFFSKLDHDLMVICESTALNFYQFVDTNDSTLLDISRQAYENYSKKKTEQSQDASPPAEPREQSQIRNYKNVKNVQNAYEENKEEDEMEEIEEKAKTDTQPQINGTHGHNTQQSGKQTIGRRLKQQTQHQVIQIAIAGIVGSLIIITYFTVQYLLFSQTQSQIQDNSNSIQVLYDSVHCVDSFLLVVLNLQISNNTWYDLQQSSNYKLLQMLPSIQTQGLNQTYQDCILTNQNVDLWLQSYNSGQYYISSQGPNNFTLCSLLADNTSSCETILQKVLLGSVLQQSSVFLQDSLYQAIKYIDASHDELNSKQWFLQQLSTQIDILDSHQMYQQPALHLFYQQIVDEVVNSQSQQAYTILLIVFTSTLALIGLLCQCFVFKKIKLSFWHAFYILRILPKEDIDKDFIKQISDFLKKA